MLNTPSKYYMNGSVYERVLTNRNAYMSHWIAHMEVTVLNTQVRLGSVAKTLKYR